MPSTASVDPNLRSILLSRYQRWRLIKDLHHHFWNRWQTDFLQILQRQTKWSTNQENLKVDTLILIRVPTAPLCWKLGRVVQLHPGLDGIVRVAMVQAQNGLLKRPTVKLCPFPICWTWMHSRWARCLRQTCNSVSYYFYMLYLILIIFIYIFLIIIVSLSDYQFKIIPLYATFFLSVIPLYGDFFFYTLYQRFST